MKFITICSDNQGDLLRQVAFLYADGWRVSGDVVAEGRFVMVHLEKSEEA